MKKPFHFGAEGKTFETAKKLRKEMTPSEKILWDLLRGRSFDGLNFEDNNRLEDTLQIFIVMKRNL